MTDKQLSPSAIKAAEFARQVWRIIVPRGTTVEDMLKPTYWGHVAAQLRTGDKIEAVVEDNSGYFEFYVRFARRLEAAVSLISQSDLPAAEITEDLVKEYRVEFRGQRAKWSVIKGKEVVKQGIESEGEAQAWLDNHLKALAA